MFKVKNIHTGQVFTVYGVNGTRFLIYNMYGAVPCWEFLIMGDFVPVEDELRCLN